ncbi:MAG: (2Fe-2S)-binding protein [Candidatus Limnocylindrales bacterium]
MRYRSRRRTAVCNSLRRPTIAAATRRRQRPFGDAGTTSPGGIRLTVESLTFRVNGVPQTVDAEPWAPLLDALREGVGLTGTKEGCDVGLCGLCSVLLDDVLVSACLVPVAAAAGRDVTTVEGVAVDGALSPVQESFIAHGGFQCGICTPGQIVAATALLRENVDPSDDEIRTWLGGNLCRCTGYQQIVEAVRGAAS